MKTILERATELAAATEKLHIAANRLSAPLTPGMADWDRVQRAMALAERAVQYTQALQAFAKGGRSRSSK